MRISLSRVSLFLSWVYASTIREKESSISSTNVTFKQQRGCRRRHHCRILLQSRDKSSSLSLSHGLLPTDLFVRFFFLQLSLLSRVFVGFPLLAARRCCAHSLFARSFHWKFKHIHRGFPCRFSIRSVFIFISITSIRVNQNRKKKEQIFESITSEREPHRYYYPDALRLL